MNYLEPEQVLFLHMRLVVETGGAQGVRDLGMLESAVARPKAMFNAQELYPTLFLKAAALLESLVNNHPFLDGNKRTGIAAAALFLLRNGYSLTASNSELEAFTLGVAQAQFDLSAMAEWLQFHCSPVN
jgi:death-on-curing protein